MLRPEQPPFSMLEHTPAGLPRPQVLGESHDINHTDSINKSVAKQQGE